MNKVSVVQQADAIFDYLKENHHLCERFEFYQGVLDKPWVYIKAFYSCCSMILLSCMLL